MAERAGSGNRTRVFCLEGRCFTIKLYPHIRVGERGFEPPTPASQTLCATKLRYSPETTGECTTRACALPNNVVRSNRYF